MRIPENLKKCVVFIGVKTPQESVEQIKYIGTAFVVSIPSKIPRFNFMFLVTAKHVARKFEGKQCFIRANLKDGSAAIVENVDKVPWFCHPHESFPSDVAAYPLALPMDVIKSLDCEAIPISCFVSEESRIKEGIGEGDEVFTVGLFSRHTGSERNLPIIRMGTIAMISAEPIQTTLFGSIEAYLIEARSIKGLSGSPVFVLKPTSVKINNHNIPTGILTIHLLGLMHGHWDLAPGESVDIDDQSNGGSVNMGIAIVIPAKSILETLNCKELVEFREAQERNWMAKNSPTPD